MSQIHFSILNHNFPQGIQVADYGKIDFDSKVDEMSIDLLHVPNWFTVDTRMGVCLLL